MTENAESPAEVFASLREQLFQTDHSQLAPAGDLGAPPGDGPELFGVVMEEGLDRGSFLVFGLRDGSASLYLSTGGGSIGGQGRPRIHAAAKRLVASALPFVSDLPVDDEHPVPSRGRVRFSFLTSDGVRSIELAADDLKNRTSELTPLFAGAHEIITEFREVDSKEAANEASYVNCLLTAIARGDGSAATITDGTSPPDPARFTEDAVDREWIDGYGFELHGLDSAEIIRQLAGLARFGLFGFSKTGRIAVQLAAQGTGEPSDVEFRVRRGKRAGRHELEIARAS